MLPELDSPIAIQEFLDALDYNCTERVLNPRDVARERMAHCFDGAVFAATALQAIGHDPLLVDLRAVDDDDHVIAVFREQGLWGAVAKSNTTCLRFRPPVFRSVRELAMSYFAFYFNTRAKMSLFEYSRPFSLKRYRGRHLETPDIAWIGEDLDRAKHFTIVSRRQLRSLPEAPAYLVDACFAGAIPEGLYQA